MKRVEASVVSAARIDSAREKMLDHVCETIETGAGKRFLERL